MIKGAKTIAEYAIRRWLCEQGLAMEKFSLTMNGSRGVLKDSNGDVLILVYEGIERRVYVEEQD